MLVLIKKHTDTFFEQPKTEPQGKVEFKMNKQLKIFSFSPRMNFFEESKWLKTKTFFEATSSVFNITDENNSFSISTPGHWNSDDEEVFNKLNKLLNL